MEDPAAVFMLADLQAEYDRLYPSQAQAAEADKEINRYSANVFTPEEGGTFLLLLSQGQTVAGGAIMACKDQLAEVNSAEFKRIWSHPDHRGKGLSKYLLAELEFEAARLGYSNVFLTTGPNQPIAVSLYQNFAYRHTPVMEGETCLYHAFSKPLAEHLLVLKAGLGTNES